MHNIDQEDMASQIDEFCQDEIFDVLEPPVLDLISNFSMTAFGLAFIKNEILLNNRQDILEFGSGLSTIFIGLLIKKFHLNSKITSVENDRNWFEKIKEKIILLDLSHIVKVVHAPLVRNEKFGPSPWYDEIILNDKIQGDAKFDMVVIDGPPAYHSTIRKSRFGAAPFIQGKLRDKYIIFLDDANREGEKEVISMWNNILNCKFNLYNDRVAISRSGTYNNSDPTIFFQEQHPDLNS